MRKYLLAAAAVLAMGTTAQADIDPYLSEFHTFPFNYCPKGWLPTDGRSMLISENQALFALLGTTFGGDGVRTFNLPNRAKTKTVNKIKVKECIATQGIFPSRN